MAEQNQQIQMNRSTPEAEIDKLITHEADLKGLFGFFCKSSHKERRGTSGWYC